MKPHTHLTLSQASKATGKSKSVISKALKNGQISANKDTNGRYAIDPAELFRVFPKNRSENDQKERSRTPENVLENALKMKELETENKLLHERLKDKEKRIDELQEERNEWRLQAQRLSLPAPIAPEMPAESPKPNSSTSDQAKPLIAQKSQLWTIAVIIAVLLAVWLAYQSAALS